MTPELFDQLKSLIRSSRQALESVRVETNDVRDQSDLGSLVRHYSDVSRVQTALKEIKGEIDAISEIMSRRSIPEVFAEHRTKTGFKPPYRIEGVGLVTVSYRWGASMPNKQAGIDWLRNNDLGELVIETVPAPSLAALAKDLADNNQELPPDIFSVSRNPYTSIREREQPDVIE